MRPGGRIVRWGGEGKVSFTAGAAPKAIEQFVDLDVDDRPRVVRVRLSAEQTTGTGDAAGANVLVTVYAGVGAMMLKRVFLLTPTKTTPMEVSIDTPAQNIKVDAIVDPAASAPPYTIQVSALVSPWGVSLEQ